MNKPAISIDRFTVTGIDCIPQVFSYIQKYKKTMPIYKLVFKRKMCWASFSFLQGYVVHIVSFVQYPLTLTVGSLK